MENCQIEDNRNYDVLELDGDECRDCGKVDCVCDDGRDGYDEAAGI